MSTKVAQPSAAEEENIIKTRFLTQTSVPRGEPPYKKLTKRFVQLCEEAEKDADPAGAIAQAHDALLREIALIELQVEKYAAISKANQREQESYARRQQELLQQIEQTKVDIEAKKVELEEAKVVRAHKEEYEILRVALMQQPSRAATLKEIEKVKQHMEKISAEGARVAQAMQWRRKQFALLFHVMEELQRTADEGPPSEGAAAEAGGQAMVPSASTPNLAAATAAAAAADNGPAQMDVDS